jgi:hypothetical protein
LLVRRWTTQRQWVSLAEWARRRKFKFHPTSTSDFPAALAPIRDAGGRIVLHICDPASAVLQLQTTPPAGSVEPAHWNVLVRKRAAKVSIPAALRPASVAGSMVDFFQLSEFPYLAVANRFAVFSTTRPAARALADSASRTLLPPDIGLILVDHWIVLDFSARPFDPIELDRLLALAQQLSDMI